MSSLADLPEIIGFYSYSREDDEDFRGTLSALRDAIQRELGAQLGRSRATFRLWQDKEAIAPGKLWETEIKNAVQQSTFFIPIVTPRMVNSRYCQFEFDAFTARERAMARNDLIFPILFVPVQGLQNEAQWRNHPVLSPIAQRQYVDWQAFRHAEVHTPAMREAIGSFARKIVEALHQPWVSPEERAREAESAARALAEEERRRQEIEARQRAEEETRRREADAEAQRLAEERRQHELDAKRRVDEENQRRQVEAETRQRAEAERLAHQAEAEQRAKEDRAFAAAKIAGTMKAVDEFLSAYPESRFVSEAKALRATLVDREESYSVAVKSDDPAVLKSFLARYPKGAGAKEVRRRLRRIDPEHPARQWPLKLAIGGILLAVALGMVLLVHAR